MYEWLWSYSILFSLMRLTFPVTYMFLYTTKITTIEIEMILPNSPLKYIHSTCFLLSVTYSVQTR